jgi:hypothetical protein
MTVLASLFVGSLGVNTHLDFNRNDAYKDLDKVEQSLRYLGVHNVRDSARRQSTLETWPRISRNAGVKFADFMTRGSPADMEESYKLVRPLAASGVLNFIEGGNQQDSAYAISRGNSIGYTATFQKRLYTLGQSVKLPVINMSFGAGWSADNNWKGNYDKTGDLSAYTDYGNAHIYPLPNQKISDSIRRINGLAKLAAASRPVIVSEIGWDESAGFTKDQIAANLLQAAFESWSQGSTKTYFYALYDDESGKYGLMNTDGTPKPAGTALHNLTTLLTDMGKNADKFTPGTLSYNLDNSRGSEKTLLLQKADGAYWIAVWDDARPEQKLDIAFAKVIENIAVFDPRKGTRPIQTDDGVDRVSVKFSGSPLLIRVVPAVESAAGTPSVTAQ